MKKVFGIFFSLIFALNAVSSGAQENSSGTAPFFTENTVFVNKDIEDYNLGPVSDGIITYENYGRYGFITIDGKELYNPDWKSIGMRAPAFSSGICVVRDSKSTATITLLNAHGRIRDLSPTIKNITPFIDGVAMVYDLNKNEDPLVYYVSTELKKVYPHLTERTDPYSVSLEIRGIECGRRAFYSNNRHAWGYLDEKGQVVIKPRFAEVRDFCNEYAMVKCKRADDSEYIAVIDKNGVEVCIVDNKLNPYNETFSYEYLSDVSEEGIYVYRRDSSCFYSVAPHKKLFEASACMNIMNGHAFIIPLDEKYSLPYVYNTKFEKVGRWKEDYASLYTSIPQFSPIGLVTLKKKYVLDAMGNEVICMPYYGGHQIYDFTEEGYAKITSKVQIENEQTGEKASVSYTGFCRPNGEIAIAFSTGFYPQHDVGTTGWYIGYSPNDGPTKKISISQRKPAVGQGAPQQPVREAFKCKITVLPSPVTGGNPCSNQNEYGVGDTIKISGNPNDRYRVISITTKNSKPTDNPYEFIANGNDTITVHYLKRSGRFHPKENYRGVLNLEVGNHDVWHFPIYLQTRSAENPNPYGEKYGYLAVGMNPDDVKKTENTDEKLSGDVSAKLFMMPMRFSGFSEDERTGKRYLCVEGGALFYNNFKFESNLRDDSNRDAKNKYVNALLQVNDFDFGNKEGGEYRIEIKFGTPGYQCFTLGKMERLSPDGKWLPCESDVFTKVEKGILMTRINKGLPSDFFEGVVFHATTRKPNVAWYPTEGFFNDEVSEDKYAEILKQIRRTYKVFKTDIEIRIQMYYQHIE